VLKKNRRILVIDDTPAIHEDFRKILVSSRTGAHLEDDERTLFGDAPRARADDDYRLDSALQGKDGVEMIVRATSLGVPYALVFADMRMPPGWSGVDTVVKILEIAPRTELCICSAYSDYSWHEVVTKVGRPGMRLIRKPVNPSEVLSIASELTDKWWRLNGEGTPGWRR
jgi:DNA-binding NtrC family response regulator